MIEGTPWARLRRRQTAHQGGIVRSRLLALSVAGLVLACASAQPPPGGPERRVPPILLFFLPETGSVNVHDRPAVFQFDEVVAERPRGLATLNLLFLVSPWSGEPHVSWQRSRITIRPRRGFRPNTVYTITMLPGLMDLHGNARRTGAVLTFSTGPTIPQTFVRGRVFDWLTGNTAPRAFVQAIDRKDTTIVYVTAADSTGAFMLRHLPPADYIIRGFVDANNNRVLDRLELWDTVTVNLVDTARVELLAFMHDTVGPGIAELTISDSVTLRVTFDRGIDSTQQFGPAQFTLMGHDSVAIPISSVRTATQFDAALAAAARARNDSTMRADSIRRADSGAAVRDTAAARVQRARAAERRDSVSRSRTLRPSRRSPVHEVVVQLGAPMQPGQYYRLHAIDIHGILGKARSSDKVILMPKPAKADSTPARRGGRPSPNGPQTGTPPGMPPSAPPKGQGPPSEVPLPSPNSPSPPPTPAPPPGGPPPGGPLP